MKIALKKTAEEASKATSSIMELNEITRNKAHLVSEYHAETIEIVEQIEMEATVSNKIDSNTGLITEEKHDIEI